MDLNLDNLFSENDKPHIPQLKIDNAVMAIVRGLEFMVGKPKETENGFSEGGYTWIPAYDEVANWLKDNHGKGLLLMGANGTGKTTMERIIRRLVDRYFGTDSDYVNRCAFTSASDIQEAWKRYCRYQIIDDIGKEPTSKEYGEQHDYFSQIIDRAEQKGQLLICSSNLTPSELIAKYGTRTMDRMNHVLHTVVFSGESFRH